MSWSCPTGAQSVSLFPRVMVSGSRAAAALAALPDASPLGDMECVRSSCSSGITDVCFEDSFSAQFGPLPASRRSSCTSVSVSTPPSSEASPVPQAGGKPQALIDRLQQLKQLQLHMQEQLKAHQLEQLQNDGAKPAPARQILKPPTRTEARLSPVQRGLWPRGETERAPESNVRIPEPSEDRARSARRGGQSDCEESLFSEDRKQNGGEREPPDRPIRSGGSERTFEEMLEEQLRLENEKPSKTPGVPPNASKAKRSFLRRGQGLSRYIRGKSTGSSGDKAPPSAAPTSENVANVVPRRKTAVLNKSVPPKTKASAKARGPEKNSRVERQNGGFEPGRRQKTNRSGGIAESSFDAWLKERGEHWTRDRRRENAELGEFELLEKAAAEISFSSNSSFVDALLRRDCRRLSSTPVKSLFPHCSDLDPVKATAVTANPQEPFTSGVSPPPPYDKRFYQDGGPESESRRDSTLVDGGGVEFDDDDTWNEAGSFASSPAKTDDGPDRCPKRAELDGPSEGDESGPACRSIAKTFPALKPKPCPPSTKVPDLEEHSEPGAAKSALLRERLVELETEMERFRKDNAALRRLRQENQEIQQNLRKERAEFERNTADRVAEWEEFKREETRKLRREKKLTEKHAAAARARPDKRERDEIQCLKRQLSNLQEDLRKREARWTGTVCRLGRRIDRLNAENGALRDQVRTLEKLRLGTWKSGNGRPGTTKSENPCGNGPPVRNCLQNPASGTACCTEQEKESCPVAFSLEPLEQSEEVCSPRDEAQKYGLEQEKIVHVEGKIEKPSPDGERITIFPNGTKKQVSADGLCVTVTFFNGDIKRTMPDQRVVYYYAEAQTTHTTYPDGLEVLRFPNQQIEKHFPDGHQEIVFPDQTLKNVYPDGREESVLSDGTVIQQKADGTKEIHFSSGQREVHTAEFKRRQYPDGTVKTVYSDGRQETRYPNGCVRLKNADGIVVMDSVM